MSVRVTKKVRRVVERLSRGGATVKEISEDTNINFPVLWPVIDKLEANGWIKDTGQTYELTQFARDGIRAADEQSMASSRPGPRMRHRGGTTRRERDR